METPNYWLVGTNWAGVDQTEPFVRRGYWEMGYEDDEQPDFAKKRNQIKIGDRIAFKAMDGFGASTITIKAIGIVKDNYDKRIYIDWKLTDIKRTVQSHGALKTIHGPYLFSESWIHEVFCL